METTVGEQKRNNPRLTKTKAEFCDIMQNLGLPYPKKLGARPPRCPNARRLGYQPATPLARSRRRLWLTREGAHGCVVGDADVSLPANLNCGV
jgi:hypothetical protein